MNQMLGKLLFGGLFCLCIPGLLVTWAILSEPAIPVKLIDPAFPIAGLGLVAGGLSLIGWAMKDLWYLGQGLPMNAYPPRYYVASGVYRWLKHPIYFGFALLVAGLAMMCRSASGLLLIFPLLSGMLLAYVVGFEQFAIGNRWPESLGQHHPLLGLPANTNSPASWLERFCVAIITFLPWLLLYYWIIMLGDSPHFFTAYFPGEANWPVWEWTESIYLLTYPFVFVTPFLLPRQDWLRRFTLDSWYIIAWGIFFSYVLPIHAPPRFASDETLLGQLLLWERSLDGPVCALPSFHAMWAILAAEHWSIRFPKYRFLWFLFAMAISISCVTVGNHTVLDVLAGLLLVTLVLNRSCLWNYLRQVCETLANSWSALEWGPIRLINHGLFAGLAALVGTFILGQFLPGLILPLLFAFGVVIGAGIWGQLVTGSGKLLRPFGFYGGILGGFLAALIVSISINLSFIQITAMLALAAPWVQLLGRFRCMVQGCCHGKPASDTWGIRVNNPHSRVCAISGLNNQAIHITPLYSLLSSFCIGLFLFRLQFAGLSASLLAGVYLILNGIFRFMEEGFRGEVQTPVFFGLKLYQWLAIASILLGIFLTCFPAEPLTTIWRTDFPLLAAAFLAGLLAWFSMGIDFPRSNLPFARLSG